MDIADIIAGEAYACKFKIRTFVDEDGKAVDTRKLKVGEPVEGGKPGEYVGFGAISQRDVNKQLVEVVDLDLDRSWVVHWDDVWDVDVIEWVDTSAD